MAIKQTYEELEQEIIQLKNKGVKRERTEKALRESEERYQKSDESHILSIMDDGIGLKAGDSNEIFDTFKRTKTSRGIEGAGLGLAIVKEIAERHAGKIWMKQGPERGINFRVSISKNLQLSH